MTFPDPTPRTGLGLVTDDRQESALPTLGSSWPPANFGPVAHTMTLWNAWWNGDPHMLSWVHYNLGQNSPVGRSFFATTGEKNTASHRPGQYRGGLLGGVDYTFWGNPVPPGEKRSKVHVPIAKRIARTSANQLFQRPPRITSSIGNEKNQEFLDGLSDNGFHTMLLEAAEYCAALGGVFLRIMWNTDISDRPWIHAIPADMGIPEFIGDKLSAVTFFQTIGETEKGDVIRHLEKHSVTSNTIEHGIYQGSDDNIGIPLPIDTFPQMAEFAGEAVESENGYRIEFPDLASDAQTVVYVPNMRPNNLWRDLGKDARMLGVSDFSGVEQLMDNLDETYSELRTEMQLTRTRLMVPEEFLDNLGKGKGNVFEPQRQVYVPMAGLNGEDGNPIEAVQMNIRYQQMLAIAADLYEHIVTGSGYSIQTFGDYEGNAPTATEIKARERQTQLTRGVKMGLWTPQMQDIIYSLMEVAATQFGVDVTPERPNIEFAEVAESDTFQLATAAMALASSGGASLDTLIQTIHPDWDASQVEAEHAKIDADHASGVLLAIKPSSTTKLGALGTGIGGENTL